jgi:CheY-like chemotaxis protein
MIVTPDGTAKLLDFGLSRHDESRLTNPGSWLGTVDYLAPEQAQDASSVDIRADIYSLGATMYWTLTGQTPFVTRGRVVEEFIRRLSQPPPSILDVRPDLPAELAAVVARMMAIQPGDRYQTPADVMAALMPFIEQRRRESKADLTGTSVPHTTNFSPPQIDTRRKPRVLIVDDEPTVRKCVKLSLISEGIECDEADNGECALNLLNENVYDLVLTDIEMPVLSGLELLKVIRDRVGMGNLKVLVFSGRSSPNEMARMMSAGADDYLVKPLSIVQLRSRVNAALRLKQSQDAAVALNRRLFEANQVMVENLSSLGDQNHQKKPVES